MARIAHIAAQIARIAQIAAAHVAVREAADGRDSGRIQEKSALFLECALRHGDRRVERASITAVVSARGRRGRTVSYLERDCGHLRLHGHARRLPAVRAMRACRVRGGF